MQTRRKRGASAPAPLTSPLQSPTSRRPRRAALRTVSKHASSSQRRAHFERVVQHHVAQRKGDSSSELWKIDESFLPEDGPPVSLDPSAVKKILDNMHSAPHILGAVLIRLRKLTNDDSSEEEDPETAETLDPAESERPDLPNLAHLLASDSFITHKSNEIRLLTACCLAEILRVSAPNPPLSESKLKAVCNLFIDELTIIAFADDPLRSYRFALLEQLAAVKAFAIFSEEAHVVADIFACFYAAVRPHQPEKYKEHLGFILSTLLTEVESIDQSLLDALLVPLAKPPTSSADPSLKSLSSYSASAVSLAGYVLQKSKNVLQVPICNFFNSALHKLSKGRVLPDKSASSGRKRSTPKNSDPTDEDDPDFENIESDLSDDVENLVVAVNRVTPDILIYVIPSLEDRLRAKDSVVRRNIAHLLGKLFMSSAETVNAYPSVFTEFLHRSRDIEPTLRAEVCRTLGHLIVTIPRHRDTLNRTLNDRVYDQSENVREVVAVSAGQTESFASSELIASLSTRLRDRKSGVRHETFRQLTSLYKAQLKKLARNTSTFDWTQSDPATGKDSADASDEDSGNPPSDERIRFLRNANIPDWVGELPNLFLVSHQALQTSEDFTLIADLEKFIFEQISSWESILASDDDLRTRSFASFVGSLDERAIVYLSTMIARKARIASTIRKICSIRLRQKENGIGQTTPSKQSSDIEGASVHQKKKTFSKKDKSPASSALNGSENVAPAGLDGDLQLASNRLSALLGRRKFRNEDTQALCWKMSNFLDKRFFEQLNVVLDHAVTSDVALAASLDAVARLSSKSALGEFVGSIVLPSARSFLFSVHHLRAAISFVSRFCTRMGGIKQLDWTQDSDLPGGREVTESTFGKENDVLCGILRYFELTSLHFADVFREDMADFCGLAQQANHSSMAMKQVLFCVLRVMSRIECSGLEETIRDPIIEQLRSLMIAPVLEDAAVTSVMAKWAARAMGQLCKDAEDSTWQETIALLMNQLENHADNATLILSSVSSLAQLAKHSRKAFKSSGVVAFEYARHLLRGTYNEKILSNFNLADLEERERDADMEEETGVSRYREFWASSFAPICGGCRLSSTDVIKDLYVGCLTELCGRAVKLMVYSLYTMDDADDIRAVVDVLIEAADKKKGDVFALRRVGTDENGRTDFDEENKFQTPSVVSAWNSIRLSCNSGILYLARSSRYFKHVSPQNLNYALVCTQDQDADVRLAFAKNLQRYVIRKGLPFRWIAALALMSLDPDKDNMDELRKMLTNAIRQKRAHIRARFQNSLSSIRKLLPEITVPVLIWLLANHPDAATDANFMPSAERIIDFLLDRLLDSNEYAAIIHEYLDALAVAKDKTEIEEGIGPATERIHALSRMATNLLKKKQAGKKWNLIAHPGSVSLPGDLFEKERHNVESSTPQKPSLLDAARKYDGVEQGNGNTESVSNSVNMQVEHTPVETPPRRRSRRVTGTEVTSSAPKSRRTTNETQGVSGELSVSRSSKRRKTTDSMDSNSVKKKRRRASTSTTKSKGSVMQKRRSSGAKSTPEKMDEDRIEEVVKDDEPMDEDRIEEDVPKKRKKKPRILDDDEDKIEEAVPKTRKSKRSTMDTDEDRIEEAVPKTRKSKRSAVVTDEDRIEEAVPKTRKSKRSTVVTDEGRIEEAVPKTRKSKRSTVVTDDEDRIEEAIPKTRKSKERKSKQSMIDEDRIEEAVPRVTKSKESDEDRIAEDEPKQRKSKRSDTDEDGIEEDVRKGQNSKERRSKRSLIDEDRIEEDVAKTRKSKRGDTDEDRIEEAVPKERKRKERKSKRSVDEDRIEEGEAEAEDRIEEAAAPKQQETNGDSMDVDGIEGDGTKKRHNGVPSVVIEGGAIDGGGTTSNSEGETKQRRSSRRSKRRT